MAEKFGAAAARIITHPMIMLPHAIGIIAWIVINTGSWLGINPIDPYPFPILGLALSLEALVLAVVLLVNQRHQTRVQEHLEHLNLQITLLAEQESTKILQGLAAICAHLGVIHSAADAKEIQEMIEKTPITALANELKKPTSSKTSS